MCIELISKIIGNMRNIEWKRRDPTVIDSMVHHVSKRSRWFRRWLVSAKLSKADNVIPKPEIATDSC
jgi:hypothetical protein